MIVSTNIILVFESILYSPEFLTMYSTMAGIDLFCMSDENKCFYSHNCLIVTAAFNTLSVLALA